MLRARYVRGEWSWRASAAKPAAGYLSLKPEQTNAFFRLMDQRYNRASTIITTNLELDAWYELFQKKPLVDALLDRLQHHCITIRIKGLSLRSEPPPAAAEPLKRAPTAKPTKSSAGHAAPSK